MAKILIKTPNTPYQTEIDTNVNDVEIREAFIGVRFVSESGRTLSVSMRDDGFEIVEGTMEKCGLRSRDFGWYCNLYEGHSGSHRPPADPPAICGNKNPKTNQTCILDPGHPGKHTEQHLFDIW